MSFNFLMSWLSSTDRFNIISPKFFIILMYPDVQTIILLQTLKECRSFVHITSILHIQRLIFIPQFAFEFPSWFWFESILKQNGPRIDFGVNDWPSFAPKVSREIKWATTLSKRVVLEIWLLPYFGLILLTRSVWKQLNSYI